MQARILNDRYEMLTPLGTGGMATVFRGRDIRLGRPVAIKLLHSFYAADTDFLARFQHEAMSAANLSSHPNIVDVYDVGKDGDNNYIVMELVEGTDLKAVIDKQAPLAPQRALAIAAQVADGLEYAHKRGMVHRDVKPQNVLIDPDGNIRIADFGIAKSHLSTAVTQTGMTFGTADYISPEQAQGRPATPQSDVYSLGVVLYEMLTGQLPFRGDTPMAVALQHIQHQPPPLRALNPQVPPALEALVLRALSKDPSRRPASAAAFARELRDYLAGGMNATQVAATPRQYQQTPAQRSYGQPGGHNDPTMVYQQPPARPATQRRAPAYAPPPPQYIPQPRERGSSFGALLLGLLLLLGILALLWFGLTTDWSNLLGGGSATVSAAPSAEASTQPTDTPQPSPTAVPLVTLPNFVGLQERDVVENRLPELGLRRKPNPNNDPQLAARFSDEPAGTIIEQIPPAGEQVPAGSEVAIIISLGPELLSVPDVAGQPFEAASNILQQAGFRVERENTPSTTVAEGRVISQAPAGGTQLARNQTVTLTVSLGDVVAFPDIIGVGVLQDAAIQQLEAAGFRVVAIDEQGADQLGERFNEFAPGEVVSATANGIAIDQRGKLVPRGADVVLGVRAEE